VLIKAAPIHHISSHRGDKNGLAGSTGLQTKEAPCKLGLYRIHLTAMEGIIQIQQAEEYSLGLDGLLQEQQAQGCQIV
jgi:hypothetical protein